MKFKIRFADKIVGLFILIAIVGLAGIMILLGANQRWFAKDYLFWSTFSSAEGLSVGMPIKLKGFEIGKVKEVTLNPSNLVDLEFIIYDTYYDKVLPNSVIELVSSPLGLGGGLVFHPGKRKDRPMPELSFIPSLGLAEGKRLVKSGLVAIPENEDVITSVIGRVGPILNQISETFDSLNSAIEGESDSPIGVVLQDLTETSARLNEILGRVNNITANLEQTTGSMRDPTGLITTLLDPKGSIATLLDDDNELYDQIILAVEDLNGIIVQLRDFTRFVNTSQPQISSILEKGRTTLDQSRDVLEAVKNNPLLRGGIPEKQEQQTTFHSYRDEDF